MRVSRVSPSQPSLMAFADTMLFEYARPVQSAARTPGCLVSAIVRGLPDQPIGACDEHQPKSGRTAGDERHACRRMPFGDGEFRCQLSGRDLASEAVPDDSVAGECQPGV